MWECSAFRTLPGQFDNYLKYIRSNTEKMDAEAKKQGLILDFKTFVKVPKDANDYDVEFCTLYPSFAKGARLQPGRQRQVRRDRGGALRDAR